MIYFLLIILAHSVSAWDDAKSNQFPYVVSLRESNRGFCGGSIISKSNDNGKGVILTAATCVHGRNAGSVQVGIGCTKRVNCEASAAIYNVQQIIIHPNYVSAGGSDYLDNDVALVILSTAIHQFGSRSIAREGNINNLANNDPLIAVGYGDSCTQMSCMTGSDTDRLQWEEMHYMITSECETHWGSLVAGAHEFCIFDDDPNNDAQCRGDSGCPIIRENGLQVGAVSWALQYCATDFPGILTSIPNYNTWINTNCGGNCAGDRTKIPSGQYFHLQNYRSAHCIYSKIDGLFGYSDCTNIYNDQHWIKDGGSGIYFRLKNKNSAKCIANRNHGSASGVTYTTKPSFAFNHAPCTTNDDELWYIYGGNAGRGIYFMLRSKNTGLCIYQNEDGRFGISGCNANYIDQLWRAIPYDASATGANIKPYDPYITPDIYIPPSSNIPLYILNNWQIYAVLLLVSILMNIIYVLKYCSQRKNKFRKYRTVPIESDTIADTATDF